MSGKCLIILGKDVANHLEVKAKRTIGMVPKIGGFNQHIATHATDNFQLFFVSFIQYSKVLKEKCLIG